MTIALTKISCINDRLIPLGLACLQAYLKANSIPVKTFNFRATSYSLPKVISDPLIQLTPPTFIMNHQDFPVLIPMVDRILKGRQINLNENLFSELFEDYARRLYENPEETKERFELIIKYVKSLIPHLISNFPIIGFSIDYLNIAEIVLVSSFIKFEDPEIQIIWGGPSITQSIEAFKLFLLKGVCDGLVIGEGEKPLLDISNGMKFNEIRGLMSLKTHNKVHFAPGIQLDLNSLPTPDYTDIPLDTYYHIGSLYRSRGCTHRCQFCAEWNLFGPRFRVRSIEKVLNDIETIIERYKPHYMIFGESLINDNLQYFESLCDAMVSKNFNMHFGTHFRAQISPELAKKAYQAGFDDAWVGFEAFSNQDLKEMNKGTNVNQNLTTIRNLTSAGFNVIAMLVVGFSNIEEEIKNCRNILKIINELSQEKIKKDDGSETPLSIQWRPAPMYVVPGSLDYKKKKDTLLPWRFMVKSSQKASYILDLEKELHEIPYEFKRPIDNKKVGILIKKIQEADRNAGFLIGGIAKYVINSMMESRRKFRKQRKFERVGILSQRFNKNLLKS